MDSPPPFYIDHDAKLETLQYGTTDKGDTVFAAQDAHERRNLWIDAGPRTDMVEAQIIAYNNGDPKVKAS